MPEQTTPRHADVVDTNARTPAVMLAFPIPPARTKEHYALEIAGIVLGGGESSRLYQKLVRGDGKAQSVATYTHDQRGPDMFVARAVISDRAKIPEVERSVVAELDRLGQSGPSAAELDRAKADVVSTFLFGIETSLSRARQLSEYELFWGDARLLTREVENYRAVTAKDVQDAAKKYLTHAKTSSVYVTPPPADKAADAKPKNVKENDGKAPPAPRTPAGAAKPAGKAVK
jgi:zinc protease